METPVTQELDRFVNAYLDVARIEEELKIAKENFRQISENDLPEAMDNAEIETIQHAETGIKVNVHPLIRAKINKKDMGLACEWFESNGMGAIIKYDYTVSFGSKEDAQAKAFERMVTALFPEHNVSVIHNGTCAEIADALINLVKEAFPKKEVQIEKVIHGKTLKSFVTKKLEKGELEDLPYYIGAFIPRVAEIVLDEQIEGEETEETLGDI